jgi:hypothetical protein
MVSLRSALWATEQTAVHELGDRDSSVSCEIQVRELLFDSASRSRASKLSGSAEDMPCSFGFGAHSPVEAQYFGSAEKILSHFTCLTQVA